MPDAHRVVHDDPFEPGCWAGTSEYATCTAPAVSDLGLCSRHLDELRGDHPRPPAGGARPTFAIADEVDVFVDGRRIGAATVHEVQGLWRTIIGGPPRGGGL